MFIKFPLRSIEPDGPYPGPPASDHTRFGCFPTASTAIDIGGRAGGIPFAIVTTSDHNTGLPDGELDATTTESESPAEPVAEPPTESAAEPATSEAPPRTTLRRRLVSTPSFGSALVALVLWWESLRPSMLPRDWLLQGAVGALCISFGVGIGGLLHRGIARLLRWRSTSVPATLEQRATLVLQVVWLIAVVFGSWRWLSWQRDHRALIGMPSLSLWTIIPMLLATVLLTIVLMTIFRSVKHVVYRADLAAAKRLPEKWSRTVVVIGVVVVIVVGSGFASNQFAQWADTNFGALDTDTAEGIVQPTSELISGGPGSLVDFDDLGFQGRTFVGETPTVDDLRAFDDTAEPMQPIRAYVGLDSAGTVEERVQLAVDELRRTGAFERSVLVVATPTGTGWINPNAARTLEYMWHGDTAIVGVQYSFLPSWVATVVGPDSAPILGIALFDAVYAAWSELPADSRPKLLAFGESLGSFAGEHAFEQDDVAASLESIVARTDGALFVGPTRGNPIYGPLVDHRDAGSPSWKPELKAVPNLRVANTAADIAADGDWPTPRVLYLHHPGDAVGTWEPANLWRSPGWADDPTPYDILEAARWTPIVSVTQEVFDLMNGFSASPGFGHDYRNNLAAAWAAVLPQVGWTAADTDRLNDFLKL
jgi:uncharacterized membrane protein